MSGIVGQNTLSGSGLIKSPAGGGAWNFIKKITVTSSTATVAFVNGTSDVVLDSTYQTYIFTFNNYQPASNGDTLSVNFSTDTGSNYNATKTTTVIRAVHQEDDGGPALSYDPGDQDLAQATGIQRLTENTGSGSDECAAGYMWLFNPASTTFVKHFLAETQNYRHENKSENQYVAGYLNTASAIDAVRFGASTNTNIGVCEICLYGISK